MADKQFPVAGTGIKVTLPTLPPTSLSSPSTSSSSSSTINKPPSMVLSRKSLQDLVKQVDPNEQLDEEVEELLLAYADDYMEDIMEGACVLASHRKANHVEIKDVTTHLERSHNVWIPGFGTDELKPYKRAPISEAHKQRIALIKKTVKKY